jgi:hypothetical protein
MSLEPRAQERIAREFRESEQACVTELLSGFTEAGAGRLTWDILELSKGSLERLRYYVEVAKRDSRDILYWAEYYDTDPLLRGRDPRQMVDEILAKWGKKA